MEPIENKLARYYRGESSLEDEQALKNAYRKGELPSEPALSYGGDTAPCPEEVFQAIRHGHREAGKPAIPGVFSR